jgi:hypothetical protein
MVITTRSQAARSNARLTALGRAPSAAPANVFRSRVILPGNARARGTAFTAALQDESLVEVLDLTGDDVVLPGGSVQSQWVDLTGEGGSGAAGILAASAKNPTSATKHSRVEWWDEEDSGPRHLSFRETTQAKRQKTDQQNAAKAAQRAERLRDELRDAMTVASSTPTPIENEPAAARSKEATESPTVHADSISAGANVNKEKPRGSRKKWRR